MSDTYDANDNARKCYDLATRTLRVQKLTQRWAAVRPDAFLDGSIQQARNTIEDMQKDIAFLVRLLAEKERA